MIIWTVLPIEQVLEGIDKPPSYEEIEYEGINLQVERLSPTQCRIVRIISTNPLDFLQPNFQPGQIISFSPYFGK